MKWKTWVIGLLLICMLFGCTREEPEMQPETSVSDTMKQYLSAMQIQDGLAMADLSVDHHNFDFTITEDDAQEIGLSKELVQQFYQQMLAFDYALDEEMIKADRAEITVHINAYDINAVLNDTIAENEETFGKINAEDISAEAKNQKIAEILIHAFEEKEKTYQFDMTFHLQLIDQVWLVENADEVSFVDLLFRQPQ